MSAMSDLDLKLKELETLINQTQEIVQSVHELLSNNEDRASSANEQPQHNPVEDKATVRKMLNFMTEVTDNSQYHGLAVNYFDGLLFVPFWLITEDFFLPSKNIKKEFNSEKNNSN